MGASAPMVWNTSPTIRNASNKLTAFQSFQTVGITTPEFTTDYTTAVEWVQQGRLVVCRTILNGHSGAGIKVAARVEDVVIDCPLYVVYKKKKCEYRVHVAFGNVIDIQHKRKRHDFQGTIDYAVRNHHTGWVYCREDVDTNQQRDELAVAAIQSVGLDFGAVDIIYNEHENRYYVLEINTAPGLEGTTIEKYAVAFTEKARTL